MSNKFLNLLFMLLVVSSVSFAQEKLQKVSIALQWLDQFQFAGYYMAKEKGFYKDVGLDVDIQKYNNRTPIEKVLNNEATYGIGGSSMIIDIANGSNIIMLNSIFQSTPMILLSMDKSHIKNINDLAFKRVMLSKNILKESNSLLFGDKIPLDKMQIKKKSHSIDDLIDNKVDVISAYISNEPFLLKSKGIKYNILNPRDYGYDFYSDILFTSKDELKNHPLRVKNFNDASLKGWEYAFNHIDESVELIFKKYNTQHKSKEALTFEANELRKLAYYKTDKLGVLNRYKIKEIYDLYNRHGLLKHTLNLDDFIFEDDDFVFFTEKEKDYIQQHNIIKYVYDPDWRPFEWKNGLGKHMGIIADILKIISKKSGLKFEAIHTNSWLESTKIMQENNADMYSAVPKTEEREKTLKFTSSDIYSYTAVFVSNISNKDLILNDISYTIKGKRIGVIKGNSLGEYVRHKYSEATFVELDSLKSGFKAIRDRKIDFFVVNAVSANYYINNKGYDDIKIYANTDYIFKLKIALQKHMPDELLSILDKTLKTIKDEQKEAIFVKWINMKVHEGTNWNVVWQIVSIASIILIVLVYIVYMQLKYNKNLTKEIQDRKIAEDKLERLNKDLDKKIENAVKELKSKNENFKELLNSTMEMIVISDEKYNVVEANEITMKFFDADISSLRNRNLFDNLESKYLERVKNALSQKVAIPYEIEIELPKTGRRTLLASGKNIIKDGKKMRISTLLDITELKQAQHRLVQQNRLAQMGEMINMIAHQWRQPLSAISATSGAIGLKARLGKLDKVTAVELSDNITDYAQHLSSTIDDFRNFFKDKKQKNNTTLREVVESTLNIVSISLANSNIKIIKNFTSDIEIRTYTNELKQVVLNIIKNAQDALIEKSVEDPYIRIDVDGRNIIISDNAGGISKDIIDRIFEPYFSTKIKKDGTGLGLYMSKTIIEEHCEGKLTVHNGKEGAVFSILL